METQIKVIKLPISRVQEQSILLLKDKTNDEISLADLTCEKSIEIERERILHSSTKNQAKLK